MQLLLIECQVSGVGLSDASCLHLRHRSVSIGWFSSLLAALEGRILDFNWSSKSALPGLDLVRRIVPSRILPLRKRVSYPS